jgi:2-oxoglutarate/2-oxoacid ferredoxin oxidoreductase subunit beta
MTSWEACVISFDEYKDQVPAWCPGCGNFGIRSAFIDAMIEMGMEPHRMVIVSGIGQAAKFPHYVKCNAFNGLHGRAIPVATGIRLANHRMAVIVETGDGDCYGEGGNHFIHAMRRNINIKLFVHNNQIYGLTKGQASPTSMEGMVTKVQPFGVMSEQFNPLAAAVAFDCSFVARGFAGDREHLKQLYIQAMEHDGFSLVDILQPCVTFNKVNTFEWYRERVEKIDAGHDVEDRSKAFEMSLRWGESIPIGVLFRNRRPTYEERIPIIREAPLVDRPFDRSKPAETLREFS